MQIAGYHIPAPNTKVKLRVHKALEKMSCGLVILSKTCFVSLSLLSSHLILAYSNDGFPLEAKIMIKNPQEYMFPFPNKQNDNDSPSSNVSGKY